MQLFDMTVKQKSRTSGSIRLIQHETEEISFIRYELWIVLQLPFTFFRIQITKN